MSIDARNKKRPELLSPAGSYEGFLACINAGCDAVYLGGSKYSARAYAKNFTDEEVIKAVRYAHVFGVKVYMTVNTLIKEREFEECLNRLKPFADAGIDAFIVQDIGLMKAIRERYPDTDLHVSTQAFSETAYSFRFFEKLGAVRVVPARELSLEELKKIKESTSLEIETFVHGAMCYCYSGECLFSSTLGGRSGNRGRCAGPCRQPYRTSWDGVTGSEQYVLSMKDQCCIEILDKLTEAGIDSFKIEGRMKSPEYAAFVTGMYRKYIDRYFDDPGNYSVDKDDLESISSAYLRTGIGTGYYFTRSSKDMITLESPAYVSGDDRLEKTIREKYIDKNRKAGISGYFYARAGEPVTFCITFDDISVSVEGACAEKAVKSATSEDSVRKQLMKLGDTPFVFEDLSTDIGDDVFIPVSSINELRRNAVKELLDEI